MGQWISLISRAWIQNKEFRILMVGLDAAGKTTILYKLKLGENVCTIPTIGFNVETVNWHGGLNLAIWDIGGQTLIRPLWRHYYNNTRAVVFVVDSADRDPDRIATAREELTYLFREDELKDAAMLVLANKQDLPNAMSPGELADALGLADMGRGRSWHVRGTSATSGDGLHEGMEWLAKTLKSR
ncbi:putative ADP ribosylation factor 1 [Endogone sp. FLAS-F59071]|nr:putative ADP ribosylation factor 1 [Endogone sp. FLAS-F59071]|eukprot:RUS22621.1 putative ADP ribosylation factor 1 [Endogone sp. FLAS-F59071]